MASFWFPIGSNITNNNDGTLRIEPPSGWKYVGYDINNNLVNTAMLAATTEIKCNCVEGKYCNPFYSTHNGQGGCLGDCKDCRMSTKITNLGIRMDSGGYINLSIQPSIISDYGIVPGGFKAMFQILEVQNIIINFINGIFPGPLKPQFIFNPLRDELEVPVNCKVCLVNIAGRAVPMPIPDNIAPANVSGETASCSCPKGTCKLDTASIPLDGTVYQCEDNCDGTCTLIIKDVAATGQIQIMNFAKFYAF